MTDTADQRAAADERAVTVTDRGESRGADAGDDSTDVPQRWGRADWLAVVVIFVMAMISSALHVVAYPTLSPIDELQHIDYMIKAGDLGVVRDGDRVGQEAMREAACRSVDAPGYQGPACGLPQYDPASFQESGYNTASAQFPLYYALTGVPARIVVALTPLESRVTVARWMGSLWLAAGLSVVWAVCAELGVRRRARALALLLLAPTPLFVYTAAIVNPDNCLLLLSACVVLAALRFERGVLPWWAFVATCLVAQAFEPTNVLAVAAMCGYLVVRSLGENIASGRDRIWSSFAVRTPQLSVGLGVGLLGVVAAYLLPRLRSLLIGGYDATSSIPMFNDHAVDHLTLQMVVRQAGATVAPISRAFIPTFLQGSLTQTITDAVTWVLIGCVLAVAFMAARRSRGSVLAGTSFLLMAAAGPIFTIHYYVGSGVYFPIPSRYGLPLMAALIPCVAAALRKRSVEIGTGLLAAAGFVNIAVLLVAGAAARW